MVGVVGGVGLVGVVGLVGGVGLVGSLSLLHLPHLLYLQNLLYLPYLPHLPHLLYLPTLLDLFIFSSCSRSIEFSIFISVATAFRAGSVALLPYAAFFQELTVLVVDKATKERQSLEYHYQGHVADVFIRSSSYLTHIPRCVVMLSEVALTSDIFLMPWSPYLQVVRPQIIAVVLFQFLKTALCDHREFVFCFAGTLRVAITFYDVLLAGTCGLLHLVYRAVVCPVQEPVDEVHGDVEDALAFLVGEQRPVAVWFLLAVVHSTVFLLSLSLWPAISFRTRTICRVRVYYPKNTYAMTIAAMTPARSARRPHATACRVYLMLTEPK